jgi:hypothetical protein
VSPPAHPDLTISNAGGPQEQSRPPLTLDLFNQHREQFSFLERYGPAQGVVRPIQRQLVTEPNLEQILGQLQDEVESYRQRNLQLMAIKFYLRDYLDDCSQRWWSEHSGVTTYAEFVDQVNRYSRAKAEQVCYVSLNYDTRLDRTLEAHSLRNLTTIDGYILGTALKKGRERPALAARAVGTLGIITLDFSP